MQYLIHAPGMGRTEMEPTAAFGAAVWLAMQAPKVQELALTELNPLILQPQTSRSDVLIASRNSEGGWTPRVWLAYAQLNAQVERAYVENPARPLSPDAWHSGDRLWMLHLIAPLGYGPDMHRLVRTLFAGRSVRSLSPRSHLHGQRVVVWRGTDCSPADAHRFWHSRPIFA